MRGENRRNLLEERLCPWHEGSIGSLRHLAGYRTFGSAQSRPVVVRQPERDFQMENIEKFDEMVRPAGRYRARSHGIFEGQIPTDDPGKDLPQCGISIGVGAAGE